MEPSITTKHSTSIGNAIVWTAAYFLLLLLVTLLDVLIWRKVAENISVWLNLTAMVAASAVFFYLLAQKTGYTVDLFSNTSIKGIAIAIGCAILFLFLLDKLLDPIFETFFPMSEVDYQAMNSTLRKSPASSFLRTCLIAPFIQQNRRIVLLRVNPLLIQHNFIFRNNLPEIIFYIVMLTLPFDCVIIIKGYAGNKDGVFPDFFAGAEERRAYWP